MKRNGRRIAAVVLVFVAMVGAISYLNWLTSPREFRGRLRYEPKLVGTPEDPPPLAYLVTETGTHELHVPHEMRDSKLLADLQSMNGKQVIVVGKWTVRRTMWKKHRAIRIEDLRLQQ